MKLTFSWAPLGSQLFGFCQSGSAEGADADLLSNILMDDGGLGWQFKVSFIDEALASVASVLDGRAATADWDCEDWGATISQPWTDIYSLQDETYRQSVETNVFHRALLAWQNFLAAGPNAEAMIEVDL